MNTEFKLISSPEADLFEVRLNRFIAELGPDVALGEIKFTATSTPTGTIVYSALVAYKQVKGWE